MLDMEASVHVPFQLGMSRQLAPVVPRRDTRRWRRVLRLEAARPLCAVADRMFSPEELPILPSAGPWGWLAEECHAPIALVYAPAEGSESCRVDIQTKRAESLPFYDIRCLLPLMTLDGKIVPGKDVSPQSTASGQASAERCQWRYKPRDARD